jgi:hypothetical protein
MRLPVATSAIDFDTKAQEADENGHLVVLRQGDCKEPA